MIARALSALGLMKRSEHEEIWLKLDWDNACLSEQIEAERAKFKLATTDLAKQAEEIEEWKMLANDLGAIVEATKDDAQKWRDSLKRSRDRKAARKGSVS